MAKEYKNIPPVKQLESTSCWAACMKWWYLAAKNIKKSQTSLINRYQFLANEDGRMSESGMQSFLTHEHLNVEKAGKNYFILRFVKAHLAFSPIMAAYYEANGSMHVNVIYEVAQEELLNMNSKLGVMEPQKLITAADGNQYDWEAIHTTKTLGDFTWYGPVLLGSLKPYDVQEWMKEE